MTPTHALPDSEFAAGRPISGQRHTLSALLVILSLTACDGGGKDGPANPPAIAAISVAPGSLALQGVGATGTVSATLSPSNATGTIAWSSSSPSVATVSGSSTTASVTAVAGGTTTITASAGGRSGSAVITVTPIVRGITPGSAASSIVVGASTTLAVTVNADPGANGELTWTSSAPAIATVVSGGVVTGVAPGSATISVASAAFPSVSATIALTVLSPPVATLTMSSVSTTLVPAQAQALSVTARDASGGIITNPSIVWSTSAAMVATVSSAGVVTAVGVGSAVVAATSGSASASVNVTVTEGGYVTSAGGTIAALGGQLLLAIPSGAVATPTAFTVRAASGSPVDGRLLAGTAITIEPAAAFSLPATLRLRYPTVLATDVVETQLRLARVVGSAWQDAPVRPVDRAGRLVSALISNTGTWGVFTPPPSLRGYAQLRGMEAGTAVSDNALRTDTAYRRVLAAEFNSVTPENAMKFGPIHPAPSTYAFAGADTLVEFAAANGMAVYGHVLLWHSQQPAWLTTGTPTRASLLAALKEHIETVVGRYAGRIAAWDVANEMITDNQTGLRSSFWTTIVGPDVIDSAFTWAHRRDPAAKLFLNDYSVEAINPKSDSLFALVTRLKAAGVPIDGVGLQAHLLVNPPSLAQISANIARFAVAGFDVRITELDVRIADGTDGLAEQATVYANVVTACRSQARCRAVTSWGFTDKYSWIPGSFPGFGRALPFDANFAPKPAYFSLRDAFVTP